MVTVYRGHRRILFYPARDYLLFIMCVGIIRNNSLVGGRARAAERVTLYCTWRPSALTTPPRRQVGKGDHVRDINTHTHTHTPRMQSYHLSGGIPANMSNITLVRFLVLFDTNFSLTPKIKLQNGLLLCLILRMLIPAYCIPTGIKLQKVCFCHFYPQKLPQNEHK